MLGMMGGNVGRDRGCVWAMQSTRVVPTSFGFGGWGRRWGTIVYNARRNASRLPRIRLTVHCGLQAIRGAMRRW